MLKVPRKMLINDSSTFDRFHKIIKQLAHSFANFKWKGVSH